MKICCISDTHGYLPKIPECDLFLHAGDICPVNSHRIKFQRRWLLDQFNYWLDTINAKKKILIWGNHDFIGQEDPTIKYNIECDIITDEIIEYNKLKIWGSPWTKRFFDWAFNMDPPDLYTLHKNIPECDIILTHGPAYGLGDIAQDIIDKTKLVNVGSKGLLERIEEIQPKLVVYGHIHKGYGIYQIGITQIINASYVNEKYQPVNQSIIVEI